MAKRTNEELVAAFQGGDEMALIELLDKNEGAIAKAAHKFIKHATTLDIEEVMQAGRVALWRAAEKFDPTRGFKFVTFAWTTIEREIARECNADRTIAVGVCRDSYSDATKEAKAAAGRIVRLDAPINDDGDTISIAGRPDDPSEQLKNHEDDAIFQWALSRLPDRSRYVIEQRLRGRLLSDIGRELSITKARTQKIDAQATAAVTALVRAKANGTPQTYRLNASELAYIRLAAPLRSCGAIAADLRRAHQTIARVRVYKRKPSGRKWTDKDREFLRKNRHKGWVWCASQLGVSAHSLRSQANRWGLQRKYKELTDHPRLLELYRGGLTTTSIGRMLGFSSETIRNHLLRLGLAPPGLNEAWRDSPKRRMSAATLAAKKTSLYAKRAADLGFPAYPLADALILSALSRIGRGDRDAIVEEMRAVCVERGWKPVRTTGIGVLQRIGPLVRSGVLSSSGTGPHRRVYSLKQVDAVNQYAG